MDTVDQRCIEDDRSREKGGITMKTLLRVFVLVTAFMVAGSGAMAAELLFAYKATPIDDADFEVGTFLQGDPLTVTLWVENYKQAAAWEIKVSLKGKGVSDKLKVQDMFDAIDTWSIEFGINSDLLPEGVYTVTFQFRETIKGAKWQKLICRFQIIGASVLAQARSADPVVVDLFKQRKIVNRNLSLRQ